MNNELYYETYKLLEDEIFNKPLIVEYILQQDGRYYLAESWIIGHEYFVKRWRSERKRLVPVFIPFIKER